MEASLSYVVPGSLGHIVRPCLPVLQPPTPKEKLSVSFLFCFCFFVFVLFCPILGHPVAFALTACLSCDQPHFRFSTATCSRGSHIRQNLSGQELHKNTQHPVLICGDLWPLYHLRGLFCFVSTEHSCFSPRTVVWSSMMKMVTAATRWKTTCSAIPAMSRGWTKARRPQPSTSTTSRSQSSARAAQREVSPTLGVELGLRRKRGGQASAHESEVCLSLSQGGAR